MRILLIEDDRETEAFIKKGFSEDGHVVDSATNGKEGLLMGSTVEYDLFIVDRMLPELDGLSIVRILRANQNNKPILVLSALSEVDQRLEGFEAGCDDYLLKPFAFSELRARVNVLYKRRTQFIERTILETKSLKMNLATRKVHRTDVEIILKPTEFRLLEYLMRHPDKIVTRTMLLENVWDYHFDPQTNVIDVHVSKLRTKIDKNFNLQLLETIRGAGYRLSSE